MKTAPATKVRKGKSALPRFDSLDEESSFWDTHSFLDFGSWEVVPSDEVCRALSLVKGPKVPVTFRLEKGLVRRLKEAARRYGIKYQVLAREILWRSLARRAAVRRTAGPVERRRQGRA